MNKIKFDIITPLYNGEKFIEEMIKSVLDNGYEYWNLWLCDDCSTDKTNAKVEKYLILDERIKFYKNRENLGAPSCRNKLIKYGNYEYLIFLDQDDILIKGSLCKVSKSINEKKISVLNINFINDDGLLIGKKEEKYGYIYKKSEIFIGHPFKLCSIVMPRLIYSKVGDFASLNGGEEWDFWNRCIEKNFNFIQGGCYLINHRKHAGQTSSKRYVQRRSNWSKHAITKKYARSRFKNDILYFKNFINCVGKNGDLALFELSNKPEDYHITPIFYYIFKLIIHKPVLYYNILFNK